MRLLLISNSTNKGEEFLTYPMPHIKEFLGGKELNCLFIPYAGVTPAWDDLENRVQNRFSSIGHSIKSIHRFANPIKAVEEADVIVVSGGSTWNLLKLVREKGLIEPIRKKIMSGTPYIGWSAGANLACPTIKTTNDMPIVDPNGFDALNLIPFQINPHFLGTEDDKNVEFHGGETREDRIKEFLKLNENVYVAGLREGCIFRVENDKMTLIGKRSLRLFKNGETTIEMNPTEDFSFLLKK
ncbi:dipeptidase PepE [Bacteroidales bacterium OttesenSCG-928-I21]|nr:dipeptidase PepE [Bacteroidales bacterium OttesenSCG-928-I21]